MWKVSKWKLKLEEKRIDWNFWNLPKASGFEQEYRSMAWAYFPFEKIILIVLWLTNWKTWHWKKCNLVTTTHIQACSYISTKLEAWGRVCRWAWRLLDTINMIIIRNWNFQREKGQQVISDFWFGGFKPLSAWVSHDNQFNYAILIFHPESFNNYLNEGHPGTDVL